MRPMQKKEKWFFWNFIRESDWIEGLHNVSKELQSRIIMGAHEGHAGAMFLARYAADERALLTKTAVCGFQKIICSEQPRQGGRILFPEELGRYRKKRVFIVKKTFLYGEGSGLIRSSRVAKRMPPPKKVPRLMKNWLRRVRYWQKWAHRLTARESANKIADFHFEFEDIHPFIDGNGRTGRVIAYYMLRYTGLRPFIFWEYDKSKTYYPACRDRQLMREYFLTRIFHPEKILGRIETVSVEDMVDF